MSLLEVPPIHTSIICPFHITWITVSFFPNRCIYDGSAKTMYKAKFSYLPMLQSQFLTQLLPMLDPSTILGFPWARNFYTCAIFHQVHFLFYKTQYDWPPSVQVASQAAQHTKRANQKSNIVSTHHISDIDKHLHLVKKIIIIMVREREFIITFSNQIVKSIWQLHCIRLQFMLMILGKLQRFQAINRMVNVNQWIRTVEARND